MPNVVVPGAAAAGAVYPDNSPANYFLNHTGSSGWVIHLSGGGWRFLKESAGADETQAAAAPLTSDGTSAADGHCYGKCDGILSDDEQINPLFHSWNKVWVPISGTSFTGDRTSDKPYPVRGKRIQEAVIADLQTRFGMGAASDIILTGGSSGGLAVYLTCDRVVRRSLPFPHSAPPPLPSSVSHEPPTSTVAISPWPFCLSLSLPWAACPSSPILS